MKLINKFPTIALVVPCYNEAEIIERTIAVLLSLLDDLIARQLISKDSFVVFVDDGSTDNTYEKIRLAKISQVVALKLSNNVGHQYALLAGLHYVTGKVDCCISLDADLQDDISAIEAMIVQYEQGSQIVYGVRKRRAVDTPFKRTTATLFYLLMKWSGVRTVFNHADFRLLSSKVLLSLRDYREVNLFLRGIFPLMGYRSSIVYYDRLERIGSESKYSLYKMMKLAINGVTSFSSIPLKIISVTGVIIFLVSIACSIWVILEYMVDQTVPGWASITLPIYFLGGIQLLAIGILGEYISKIYWETKARPRYHVDEAFDHSTNATTKSKAEWQDGIL
jgi:polyisoprenyl-phosphate glycosyltransferase